MTTTTAHTPQHHSRGQRPAPGNREAGSVSLEVAIVFPVLLAVVVAIVQFGLWFNARSLALAAAQDGVTAARTYAANPAAGPAAARAFLDAHGADTLTDITITGTTPGPSQVGVEVTGRSLSVLPGVPGLLVRQSATGPVERFTTAGTP
ncbi:TadE/TadG family type IV pilus assembly protein [Cellulomonas fimi]|uniref:Pilus assembly protein n=1 Tax=Cellulomonas fimi TaxID=1708 RepID=A0A7Y0LYT2_CELFI|nr:TadE/TadG family type IV pilus assembly protein [Cellulomonas fimi]NMR19222.1 pilus assembly protein [Cellulomonas fimi]